MAERDDYNRAFTQERFGPGAGIPTTLGGTLGQMAARQQKERRAGPGPSGHILFEMLAGGPISRGVRGSWLTTAAFTGGWLIVAGGFALIAFGVMRALVRAVRRLTGR
jgi:uncharacterized membrane protein